MRVQSGMQETATTEVALSDMEGSTLQAMVSYMYGKLSDVATDELVPLFIAADKYQVSLPILSHMVHKPTVSALCSSL